MKQLAALVAYLLLPTTFSNVSAQNLCPNPGFEQLTGCPSGAGEIGLAFPWDDAGAPADLFSFCHVNGPIPDCSDVSVPSNYAGVSGAHTGSCYSGFFTRKSVANERSYIQAPLLSPLSNGQLYKVTAYFKRSSFSRYATNSLGIAFATSPLAQAGSGYIPLAPQAELTNVVADTSAWTQLTSYYTGTGLEDQIVFGNFRNDASTTSFNFAVPVPACSTMIDAAFYYLDDISVTAVSEQLSVSGDTLICTGETTQLTGTTNTNGWWSLQTTPNDTLPAPNHVLTVSPSANTVYLWHGMQSTISITVSISAPPLVTLPPDTILCDGTTVTLDATNTSSSYLWSTGDTTAIITVVDSGTYMVTVNNGHCFARDTFALGIIVSPDPELGDEKILCSEIGETLSLDAGIGLSYYWTPGGDTTRYFTVTEPGTYHVLITHASGCTKSDSVTVTEFCKETLYIPGAFTPNNDGRNDLFYADGTNVLNFEIIIFNRWGQPVFNTSSLGTTGAWDGKLNEKPVPEGLYTYQVSYDSLQSNGKKKLEKKSGTFVLYR